MKVIDGHAHIIEVLKGYGARGEFRATGHGRGIWMTGEVEQFFPEEYGDYGFLTETLIKLMDYNHVDHAVLLQGGNYGFHNEYAYEAARNYPDRFTAVATLDPYSCLSEKIMDNLIQKYGFKALKFEISQTWGLTGYHPGLRLDNAQFAPIFARANEVEMTVAIDMGPLGTASFNPEQITNVLKKYPHLEIVMTHTLFPCNDGKNAWRLRMLEEMKNDRLYFDIANLPPRVYPEPYPYTSQLEFLREAKKIVSPDHFIWGTDVPSTLNTFTYVQLRDYLLEGNVFTDSELELVMAENAIRAYKIK